MTRRLGRVGLALALATLLVWFLIPRPDLLGKHPLSQAVFDRDGSLLRLTLASDDRYRLPVRLAAVSPELVQAILFHEDQYFWLHPGVNPISLVRAAIQTFLLEGRRVGGSTLTMQLARIHFDIHSRSLAGKLEQVARALQLERHYSKTQLLEAYLLLAPFGGNVEGIAAASLIYLGKEPSAISLEEALALAVIPQSPARRSPEHPLGELRAARDRLLERWSRKHTLDQAEQAALRLPMDFRKRSELPFRAPHFTRAALGAYRGRNRIFSTLDGNLQADLEALLQSYVKRNAERGLQNASALLLDYDSMEVRTWIGSADFRNVELEGQVDGTSAKRSPGSALKPFVYALAIDRGLIHPQTMLADAPQSFGEFNPENFDGDFRGPIHAVDALVDSRNVPAVGLAAQLGKQGLYDFLERARISRLRERDFYGLASVLGGVELTMQELLELYAMLGNGGLLRPLRIAHHATATTNTASPTTTPTMTPTMTATRLLSPEASVLTLEMLEKNRRPSNTTGAPFMKPQLQAAWKTGTSHGFRDAWAVGLFGPYALAVWVGHFDGHGDPALTGRQAAAPLFFEMIDTLRHGADIFEHHYATALGQLNLIEVDVCSVSGRLPGEHCPHRTATGFIPGQSPIDRCDIHRRIEIEIASGLRACPGHSPPTRSQVYEFWPSDLLHLFTRAGIPRGTPPPYPPDCALQSVASFGIAPRITTPNSELLYHARTTSNATRQIGLSAISDGDVKKLYWFLDGKLLGHSRGPNPFYWTAEPGQFTVLAVDDHGRSDSTQLRVDLIE